MIFYVNDEKYNIDYLKMQKKFINTGLESDIYKFDNKVFKIYKDICLKYRLDEKNTRYLSKISTKRIVLPDDIIFDENNEFLGYTMKYIKPESKDNISNMNLSKLLKELLLIKKDLLLLRDNNVFVDDLSNNNFIFNNGIYIIDPGSYEINKNKSKEYIEIMNREIMNDFIIKYILFGNYDLDFALRKKIYKYFPLDEYIYDVIKSEKNKKQLIYEYSDRIINSL